MTLRPTLDQTYLEIAHVVRKRSTCGRGKVGVLIAQGGRPISIAYNGSQAGDPHCEEIGCETESNVHLNGCRRTVHAELNGLLDCASRGVRTVGSTMYCTHSPCYNCAKAIVMAGIQRFVYTSPYRLVDGLHYLQEHNVTTEQFGRAPAS